MDVAVEAVNGAFQLVVPEIILVATACVAFALAPFFSTRSVESGSDNRHKWALLTLLGLMSAGFAAFNSSNEVVINGLFRVDPLVSYTRLLGVVGGVILSLMIWSVAKDSIAAECQGCLLCIVGGVHLTAMSNDLVSLFLALELVSIPTYVMLYLPGSGDGPKEATLKYFLLSIFSTSFFLLGLSYVYGVFGTTSFPGIAAGVSSQLGNESIAIITLSFVLILCGLSFRIAAVPFHFYAPDVFQGVTPSGSAMLSFIPKVAGFVALFRVVSTLSLLESSNVSLSAITVTLLSGIAIMTMFLGNLMALRQRHLFRMMAYSSIAHAGYMMAAFSMISSSSVVNAMSALVFYLAVYGLCSLGVFAGVICLNRVCAVTTLSDLAGLGKRLPLVALMFAVSFFGLAGLPPTAGFFGKLNLFLAIWQQASPLGQLLAVLIAVNAAISGWYYLRVVSVMFFDEATSFELAPLEVPATVAMTICSIGSVAVFVAPMWLWKFAESVAQLAV